MVEFEFKITLGNGATLKYSFRAKDKLEAYAILNERFPAAQYEKLKP